MTRGCPADEYTVLEPRSDLEDRFRSETLKFPSSDFVYIQCDVAVCDLSIPNDPDCITTCRAPSVNATQQVDVSRVRHNK
jgi:hypothetical protein